jgi:hypothetical protein
VTKARQFYRFFFVGASIFFFAVLPFIDTEQVFHGDRERAAP